MATPPHLRVTLVKRSKGQSVIACAAYRSAQALYNEREQRTLDYRRKRGVLYSEIFAPEHAPEWVKDREKLWNTVEAIETRKNSRYAREITIALPRQLTREQNKALLREYIAENFVKWGMVADLSIHESRASDNGTNPHAHVLLSLRDIHPDGFGEKNRTWDQDQFVHRWRQEWEKHANRALEEAGYSERIDMRSYEKQGIDKEPTEHLGHEAWNREKKGEKSIIGSHNRRVKHRNRIRQIREERKRLAERDHQDMLALYGKSPDYPGHLREVAERHAETDDTTLRDVASNTSGENGTLQRTPSRMETPPAFVGQSLVTDDPAMKEAYQRHREALQRAYGHPQTGAIMRMTMRYRMAQWKAQVIGRGREIFSRLAERWQHNRDAHRHLRKEKDQSYER